MNNLADMNNLDIKLKLLSGDKFNVGSINIVPYNLWEVKDYGYSSYMDNIKWITVGIDDFLESFVDEQKREILKEQSSKLKSFDFYVKFGGKEFQEILIISLCMIFRTDDVKIIDDSSVAIDFEKNGFIVEDDKGNKVIDIEALDNADESKVILITRDNFDEIVEIVKYQNYLASPDKDSKENKSNPVDEATRKLMEQMEANREKVAKKKKFHEGKDEREQPDIYDIISAVSAKSNSINKFNIWELTLYELYDEYSRLELFEEYKINIKAMMAGAEKIDLRNWSSKL